MKRIMNLMSGCLLMTAFAACTNDGFETIPSGFPIESNATTAVLTMRLQGSVMPFIDHNGTTRAATDWTWQNGAVVYLQFYNGSERIRGHAVYNKSTDIWEIPTLAGTIGTSDKCEVYYFDGASTSSQTHVTLGSGIGIYADRNASYVFENGDFTISASLKPQTSRIRFLKAAGTNVSSIEVEGITIYTAYDAINNTFTTSSETVGASVGTSGYTPYIYANFTNTSNRQLGICNNVDGFYTQFRRTFGSNVLQTGHSGYITIPTEDTNKGWTVTNQETKQFIVTGNGKTVTFTMKRVEAGTFLMGGSDSNASSDQKPVHSVTLTKDYYMGVTEVTQALWHAVMGLNPTSDDLQWSNGYGLGDNYPAYYISYEDCESFISSLNSNLSIQLSGGEKFNFPTEAQWEYAARGGFFSKGYLFAGSNDICSVAWTAADDDVIGTHPVAQKQANELGLYDMSGNVIEWCLDWYDRGYYSNSPSTDPVNTTTASSRVVRGGAWNLPRGFCSVAIRSSSAPTNRAKVAGLRLVLQ